MAVIERDIPAWAAAFWRGTQQQQIPARIDCDLSHASLLAAMQVIGPGEHGAYLLTVHDYAKHMALHICYQAHGVHYQDIIRVVHTHHIPEDAWALENGQARFISEGA